MDQEEKWRRAALLYGEDDARTLDALHVLIADLRTHEDMGDRRKANRLQERYLQGLTKLRGEENDTVIYQRFIYAYMLYRVREYRDALPLIRSIMRRPIPKTLRSQVPRFRNLFLNILVVLGYEDEALAFTEKTIAEVRDGENSCTGSMKPLLHEAGYLCERLGRYQRAAEYFREELAAYEEMNGTDVTKDSTALFLRISECLRRAGDRKGELRELRELLNRMEWRPGSYDPDTLDLMERICEKLLEYSGKSLVKAASAVEARALCERYADMAEVLYMDYHRRRGKAALLMAECMERDGNPDGAILLLKKWYERSGGEPGREPETEAALSDDEYNRRVEVWLELRIRLASLLEKYGCPEEALRPAEDAIEWMLRDRKNYGGKILKLRALQQRVRDRKS